VSIAAIWLMSAWVLFSHSLEPDANTLKRPFVEMNEYGTEMLHERASAGVPEGYVDTK